jgi:hypothetical protein
MNPAKSQGFYILALQLNIFYEMAVFKSAILSRWLSGLKSKIFHGMTIFSKIIAGDIPSYKIAEKRTIFCFLDIAPLEGRACIGSAEIRDR